MGEQENVEVVRGIYTAFGKGDIAGVLNTLAEDVEWVSPGLAHFPWTGRRRGREQVAHFFATLLENIEILEFEPQEFMASGEHVVVTGHERSRAKPTGRTCEFDWLHLYGMRAGRVASFSEYIDTAAVAAAFDDHPRRAQLRAIADAYFKGLAKKDLSAFPYDDNVVLHAPMAPGGATNPVRGKQAVLAFFSALYPALGEVRVIDHFFNEDLTAIFSEAEVGVLNPRATLRVADSFRVNAAGKVTVQENHYDPRDVSHPGWRNN